MMGVVFCFPELTPPLCSPLSFKRPEKQLSDGQCVSAHSNIVGRQRTCGRALQNRSRGVVLRSVTRANQLVRRTAVSNRASLVGAYF